MDPPAPARTQLLSNAMIQSLCTCPAGSEAAPKCSKWQDHMERTNFGVQLSSNKRWKAVSLAGKTITPYNQFCFKLTEQARHDAWIANTCKEEGFAVEDCCVQAKIATVTIPTGKLRLQTFITMLRTRLTDASQTAEEQIWHVC